MQAELDILEMYCKRNHVEINFGANGISIWSTGDGPALKLSHVTPSKVESAVGALIVLRQYGWESS